MRRKSGRRSGRLRTQGTVLAVEPLETRDAPSATQFLLSGAAVATAGIATSFTVRAADNLGVTDSTYTGTIHFTSTDSFAELPDNYRFTKADNGQHTFSKVTFQTTGSQTITATDILSPDLTGEGSVFVFESRGSGVQLSVSQPEIPVGGIAVLNGTLTSGNEIPVSVSIDWDDGSSPTNLVLQPGTVTFTASHTFHTPGAFTIQATAVAGDSPPLTGTTELNVDNVPLDVAMDTFFVVADVGQSVTLTGRYSNPTGGLLTATVDFDDGSNPQPLALAPDGTFSLTHAFTGEDVYDVTVTLDDGLNTVSDDALVLVFFPDLNDGTSQAVPPGGQATVGAPGITAQVDHAATNSRPAVLTVGRYDTLPVSDLGHLVLAAYELRLAGAGQDDRLTVTFSVPTGFGDDVRLDFFDTQTHTFRPAEFSPGSFTFDPVDHTITVVFDQTSFPRVTDLHGTIFTISVAVPEVVPSVVGVSFASTTAAAPASFSSAGQRTLTLSPSTDGGPSVAQALLSGEGRGSDDDQAADQVAAVPDPWSGGDDAPLAGRGPVVGTDGGTHQGQDDAEGAFLLWPLSPDAVVPVWPLSVPMPKETSEPDALSQPRKDGYWIEPTPEKVSPSAGAVLAVLALAPVLMHNKSRRRRASALAGENPSSDCPI